MHSLTITFWEPILYCYHKPLFHFISYLWYIKSSDACIRFLFIIESNIFADKMGAGGKEVTLDTFESHLKKLLHIIDKLPKIEREKAVLILRNSANHYSNLTSGHPLPPPPPCPQILFNNLLPCNQVGLACFLIGPFVPRNLHSNARPSSLNRFVYFIISG